MTVKITAAQVEAILATIRMPSLGVYGGDWLRDPVSSCSLAANGLWFRAMLVMHDAKPYGHLVSANGLPLSDRVVAKRTGCDSIDQFKTVFAELDEVGVPGRTGDASYDPIFKATFDGATVDLSPLRVRTKDVIYSRRMVRDQRLRVLRRLAGRLGWNARTMLEAQTIDDQPVEEPKALTQQQQYVKLVLDAVAETLRPEFHPGRVAKWISLLGSPEAVRDLVIRYPTKPADYIEKVVQTTSRSNVKEPPHGNNSDGPAPKRNTTGGRKGGKRTAAEFGNQLWTPGARPADTDGEVSEVRSGTSTGPDDPVR